MDLKKSFGEDKGLAQEGKWFDLEDGGRVKVAKLNSPAFRAEVQRLQRPHLAVLRSSMDTSALTDEITIKAMAKTILLDFENIILDGVELVHDVTVATRLLTDFPDFKDMISELSVDRQNYMPEDIAEK